jgi:hypothetical protein
MHRSEELGLSRVVDAGMTEEWYNDIVSDLQPAIDLIEKHLNSGYDNPGGEYFNLSWPLGHTPYMPAEQKKERTEQGLYEEIEFDDYVLNCNYFRKGTPEEYIVHGIRPKYTSFAVGKHVKRYIDTIAEIDGHQDRNKVMLVMYKGPNFSMQWHNDSYTYNRYQLPITTTPFGQFGWQYTHNDGSVEETWLSLDKGVTYWVDTQTTHIFDNSRPGCTGRIHFMVDYLDWKPHYENGFKP